ncbi:secernin-2 isoform X1 [Ixodes scapularis]|uniref:secernin-2 isoform X1 n=1 Tax=Ixodes scapularis TaxID=6945 RepID=UPI001A9FF7AA|nr:secernin-2 isoform X1 [Ixodes scapularis]
MFRWFRSCLQFRKCPVVELNVAPVGSRASKHIVRAIVDVDIAKKRMVARKEPVSCDTFVVLPPATKNGCIVFGKNSDRPAGEVQEVVYVPRTVHGADAKLQCTYIEVDQVAETSAVMLSKPAWMWGAEMGANEHGVCIGNEAVFTHLNGSDDNTERLLGMDLVRLGLERGKTARESLDVVVALLEKHGQGGPCSDTMPFTYHNSFLIADRTEAWVLETAGKLWAAEQVTSGCRNISNCLSIETKMDLCSQGLRDKAKELGLWDEGKGDFSFRHVFSTGEQDGRFECGKKLLQRLSQSGDFGVSSMTTVLRDKASGICRDTQHERPTVASQVSVLSPMTSERLCCHWFTGTPDPAHSVFKPFVFCDDVVSSRLIVSPVFENDPAKKSPRFKFQVDRRHVLYRHHERVLKSMQEGTTKAGKELRSLLVDLEDKCMREVESFLESGGSPQELRELFKDVVETEVKFYK